MTNCSVKQKTYHANHLSSVIKEINDFLRTIDGNCIISVNYHCDGTGDYKSTFYGIVLYKEFTKNKSETIRKIEEQK